MRFWIEIELNDCTPSLSQACRLKKLSQSGERTQPITAKLMREEKANQRETVRLPAAQLRKYAPKANQKQLEEFVLRACEYYQRFLNRRRENER